MFKFIREYNNWKKEHRQEVQEAKLRKEAMKTPLNYQVLDKMFQLWTANSNKDQIMEIKGLDFTVIFKYDNNGQFQRLTTTEQILRSH